MQTMLHILKPTYYSSQGLHEVPRSLGPAGLTRVTIRPFTVQ